ncbi:MAG: peptidoglycan/xylan/chitin deacetylase (PgdA/CDA1 family) [Planctomycetota bacterium]|jgi:peptidoglycan/xylan/chitin deacetylase (PgdA/CDA1 family)
MVFHSVPTLIQSFFPNRTWKKLNAGQKIFLTFDDGPVPGVTDYVLNELIKREMKATFFMVGANVEKSSSLAKEVIFEGNGVGNHTFHHLDGWKTRLEDYLTDVEACNQILEKTLNVKSKLFRPPYGTMTERQAKVIRETHELIMWNVLTGDYDRSLSPDQILKNTLKHINSGTIVVLHDQEKTRDIIRKVLPDLLDFLADQGFKTAIL